ncbi:MAG: hypothetical protein HGA65_07150, partial [Oscillochloris sp.]|nr:hypothetical protein [Oscillochloris sp.]
QQAAPELELLRLVGELRGEGEASFGLRETVSGGWNEAEQRFRAFAAQVHQTLANYALVETRVEQALIGRSSVDLSGGVRSLMRANLGIEQAEMHHTSLSLALESRAALLRTFTTVMRGAAIVATMLSSPIGTVAALPAAWKFVDQLLSDI